jgi:hypothetical protein
MRIRIPHRVLLLGTVLLLLCALPAVTPSTSVAKPYGWDPAPVPDAPNPPPSGDGDGTIVKARYIGDTTIEATTSTSVTTTTATRSVGSTRTWSVWRTYLLLMRWGFGARWTGL